MKKNIIKLGFSFLIAFLNLSISFSQSWADHNGIIESQLNVLIQARYGSIYKCNEFSVIDTLTLYASRDNENVQDPYRTLKGCILFSAYKDNGDNEPDNYIAGMVKNGQIVWDNAPGTRVDLGGELLYAEDINNDGDVDLVVKVPDRESLSNRGPTLYYIYVLSWNGTRGMFINASDSSGCSTLLGDGGCELMDKDGNGIQEIRTTLPDIGWDGSDYKTNTYPDITYGWNGRQYGLLSGVEQIAGNEFLPANRVHVSIKCHVEKTGNDFRYNYIVSSDSLSKQVISDIYIGGLEDTSSNLAPPKWQSGSSSYIGGRAFIKYDAGTYYLIHPGQTMGGFRTVSPALPTIVNYYVQGYTFPVFGSSEQERQNILNNSVTGYTLGTRDTSIRIVPSNFIDTLVGYITHSYSLGWIKNQVTVQKYVGYFNSAKIKLQQNDITSIRTTLLKVLSDANIDSANELTNEAYTLIRYNTEHLMNQISGP